MAIAQFNFTIEIDLMEDILVTLEEAKLLHQASDNPESDLPTKRSMIEQLFAFALANTKLDNNGSLIPK